MTRSLLSHGSLPPSSPQHDPQRHEPQLHHRQLHKSQLGSPAPAPPTRDSSDNPYDRVAPLYDFLGDLYSLGAIRRAKAAHVAWLIPGDRVLYAGAGTGSECAAAAAAGASVTICDSSPRMLKRASHRLNQRGLTARLEQRDALERREPYDVVVAPFFLNVFAPEDVGPALSALAAQVRPGGRLISVDFRAPTGPLPFRLLQRAYYLPPQLLFGVLARNPWHPLYDYETIARDAAPDLVLKKRATARVFGLSLFETLCWTRPG